MEQVAREKDNATDVAGKWLKRFAKAVSVGTVFPEDARRSRNQFPAFMDRLSAFAGAPSFGQRGNGICSTDSGTATD
jgi:hypothetical protein